MDNQVFETLSYDLKSKSNIYLIYNKTLNWLNKISADVEEQKSNYISAFHQKLYPSFPSKIYFNHIDPSYWKKKIILNFIQQNNDVILNIKIYSINKGITNIANLKNWWFYWVYDLSLYLDSEIINDTPSYSMYVINQMQKEVIHSSRYKILAILINTIIGIFFLISPLQIMLRIIVGASFILSAIVMGYDAIKMYHYTRNKLGILNVATTTEIKR